jgi:hypothetical protein
MSKAPKSASQTDREPKNEKYIKVLIQSNYMQGLKSAILPFL